MIDWSATNEVNSRHYIVERSNDGINFTALKTVNSKGNNGIVNKYSTVDNNPGKDLNYYHLKQVDADGKFSYSQIATVRFASEKQLQLYPNPVSTSVVVQLNTFNSDLGITITSEEGKMLHQERGSLQQLNNSVNRFLPKLKPGYYNIKVQDKKEVYNAQMIRE